MRAFEYGEYRISKEIAMEFQGFQIKIYNFRLSISSTSCGRLCAG